MDGARWIPNGQQLEIERLSEVELSNRHLHFINRCMDHDLWLDISHTYEYKMRELLLQEIKIRMNAL